jgi:hypothetical protein
MLYKGGHRVEKGTYWDTATGERVDMEHDQVLPGSEGTIYLRAKSAVVLLAGPVLGLLFAIFLPLIGIVMTFGQVGKRVGESAAGAAARSVSFGWRPIEAYLAGRKKVKDQRVKKEEQE